MSQSIRQSHILPLYLQVNLVRLPAGQELFSLNQVLDNHKTHSASAEALCKYSALVFIQRHVKKWVAARATARGLLLLPFQDDILAYIMNFLLKDFHIHHPILALALRGNSTLVVARISSHTGFRGAHYSLRTPGRTADAFIVSREFSSHFPSEFFPVCSRFFPLL